MNPHFNPYDPEPVRTRPKRRAWIRVLAIALFIVGAVFVGSAFGSAGTGDDAYSGPFETEIGMVRSAWHVGISELGENPSFDPVAPNDPLPICEGTSEPRVEALTKAFALMNATPDGAELYQLLVDEGVCVAVRNIPYNSAFISLRYSPSRSWSNSEIAIDRSYATSLYPDVLAAILVHEATHFERAFNGTACYLADACTTLENGVELEEEIAAHAEEAEWWIDAYGTDGKEFAFGSDHALNELKSAYLRGPGDFRELVLQSRSDPREGEGI